MNYFIDTMITWKAKGILSYFLSAGRKLTLKEIETISKESRDTVYSVIKELIDNGYIERVELREKGKFNSVEYRINNAKVPYTENTETGRKDIPSVSSETQYFETERYFKDLINYDQLVSKYRGHDIDLLNEIMMNIMDMYYGEYTTVNRDRKPQVIIRSVLSKLNHGKIEYVLNQYKGVTTEIKNAKGYLQTIIYNSVFEVQSKYENWKKIEYEE